MCINKKNILVVGDVMLDIYYHGYVSRISPEAPVPILKKTGGLRYVLGGAANVAMNIVTSGGNAVIVGAVGDDENGQIIKELLGEKGIDSSMICTCSFETISKIRFLSDNNQQLLRMDIEDVDNIEKCIDYKALLLEIENRIKEFDIIVLSDYLKGTLSDAFTHELIQLARNNSIRTLVDVKSSRYEKYQGTWLLKPNKKELNALTQMPVESNEDIIEAGKFLLNNSDCEYVLITCGANGMILIGKDYSYKLDTVGKEVYDVTGAGDTVIAYLASQLADGNDIRTAMEVANYAAGIQVGKVGTSSVYLQEVKEVMDGLGTSYLRKKLRWRNLDEFSRKKKGKKIVFTNGCFDILHVGHKRYLEEARKLGDLLVVGVNSDESVRRLKGMGRPVNIERDRVEMLTALDCVDYVIVFEDDTPYDLIERIKPDVLVKGGDYQVDQVVGRDIVEANGGTVVIIPLVEGKSTTAMIERIKE